MDIAHLSDIDMRYLYHIIVLFSLCAVVMAGCGGGGTPPLEVSDDSSSGGDLVVEEDATEADSDSELEPELEDAQESEEDPEPVAEDAQEPEEDPEPELEDYQEPEEDPSPVFDPDPIDLDSFCGDEPDFPGEPNSPIEVTADDETGHDLLPEIVLTISGDVDLQTIDYDAIRVEVGGEELTEYLLTAEDVENGVRLVFKNGADGKRAWVLDAEYSFTLCRQIKTVEGLPIGAITVKVETRGPNQTEDIGLSHSGGTRSGVFYLPSGFDPEQEYPLALLIHGMGGNGAGMVGAFEALADSEGVILLGPDGFNRMDPIADDYSFYFNPNHVAVPPEDYTFVVDCLDRVMDAFNIDESKILVAGMSMGAPASLFFAGSVGIFTHGAMLHGVRWNSDPGDVNEVANLLWSDWEITPLGLHRPLFWYSSSTEDWVTNYEYIPIPGLSVDQDLAYIQDGGYEVTDKFDYPGGHYMGAQEKQDLFNWFLLGIEP